jgi:putative membrane protein
MDDPAPKTRELKKQTAEIKRSAKAVEQSADDLSGRTGQLVDSADQRTELAGDRTTLAVERTYAAWVRTALAALASGVGARALMKNVLPDWVGKTSGSVLILFAGFCLVAAVWREFDGDLNKQGEVRPLPHALLAPINSLLLLVAIAALVGIWAA